MAGRRELVSGVWFDKGAAELCSRVWHEVPLESLQVALQRRTRPELGNGGGPLCCGAKDENLCLQLLRLDPWIYPLLTV